MVPTRGKALTSIHIFLARDAMAIRVHKDEFIGARMLAVIEPGSGRLLRRTAAGHR